MPPDFVAALRPVLRWLRTEPTDWDSPRRQWYYAGEWWEVLTEDRDDGIWVLPNRCAGRFSWHPWQHNGEFPATSAQQAVDVLCSLGMLPPHLSSLYEAGRAEGWQEGQVVAW